MIPEPSIQCGAFTATVEYGGYIGGSDGGSTYYDVRIRVTTLAEAIERTAVARDAIKRERPRWSEITGSEPRLQSSDWRGNPVYVVLSYVVHADD